MDECQAVGLESMACLGNSSWFEVPLLQPRWLERYVKVYYRRDDGNLIWRIWEKENEVARKEIVRMRSREWDFLEQKL